MVDGDTPTERRDDLQRKFFQRMKDAIPLLLLWLLATAVLMGFIRYFDNTNLVTTNGLWKSIAMRQWVDFHPSNWDPANLIYYPVTSIIIRMMPESVFGPVWKSMAYVNALWGGLALVLLFSLLRRLGLGVVPASAAVVFQIGCPFFLALSTTSEDIMPGVAFLTGTVLSMVLFARRPSHLRIALVAVLFTITWFFEWRLSLPTALPLMVALYSVDRRLKSFSLYLLTALAVTFAMVLAAAIMAVTFFPVSGSIGDLMLTILWPGKGLGTGWQGLRLNKFAFLLVGITQYLFGGRNMGDISWLTTDSNLLTSLLVFAFIVLLGGVFVRWICQREHEPSYRVFGILLGGTMLLGQLFNLDVQPQDPQFQINPMMWLPFAWAFVVMSGIPLLKRWPIVNKVVLILGTVIWIPFAMQTYESFRHLDSIAETQVTKIRSSLDLDRTVIITNGFEGINTWLAVMIDWSFPPVLVRAPQKVPQYKPIFLLQQATVYSDRSPGQSASAVRDSIDAAIGKGFQIVINTVWDYNQEQFVNGWSTVSAPQKPIAIYRMLKDHYDGAFLFDVYGLGKFYRLRQKRP